MRFRAVMLFAALTLASSLFAQNEVAVFLNRTSFKSTTVSDPTVGLTAKLKFDSKNAYGISFDRYISPTTSVQFLAQNLKADTVLEVNAPSFPGFSTDAGSLELKEYDVALHWHFGAGHSFKPYVGFGIARIQGGKIHVPADLTDSGVDETHSLDDKTTWVADAGIDFQISPNLGVIVTAKYVPYKTSYGADPSEPVQKLKLDPRSLAAGLRWRF